MVYQIVFLFVDFSGEY